MKVENLDVTFFDILHAGAWVQLEAINLACLGNFILDIKKAMIE